MATRLRFAVQELMVLRTELLVRLEAVVADPTTSRTAREALTKAINSLTVNGKADDVVGALRDLLGAPVWDGVKARYFDHLQEVAKHTEALANARSILFEQSRRANQMLLMIVDDLNVYRRGVMNVLEKTK